MLRATPHFKDRRSHPDDGEHTPAEPSGQPPEPIPFQAPDGQSSDDCMATMCEVVQGMAHEMQELRKCLLLLIASRDYYGWSKWDPTEKEKQLVQQDRNLKDSLSVAPEETVHMRWVERARDLLRDMWPDRDPMEPPKRPDMHPDFDR